MELTIFLAKVLGVYMSIIGIAILFRRKHVMLAIFALAKERFAQLIAGTIALLVGLLLVNVHNDWSSTPAAIVSLIGWAAVLKGIFYLFLPEAHLSKVLHALSERSWYLIDGIIVLLVGLYLAGTGFALF